MKNDTGAAVLRVRDIDEKKDIKSKSMKELAFCYVIQFNLQTAAMLLKELLPVRYSSNGEGFFLMLCDS